MTATMRQNYELFGEYMCLDMMKRAMNKLAWPYTGIALYDKMGHVCVCLEGFICCERYDMYLAKAQFLSKHATKRSLSDIKILAGDELFHQSMVKKTWFHKGGLLC